jgi:lipopolysaccharide export system protein LptA
MAEIADSNYKYHSRKFLIILLLSGVLPLFINASLSAQNAALPRPGKRMIEVLNADEGIDLADPKTGTRITRLLGNVGLRHKEVYMYCDSAHFYPGLNQLRAYSRINMHQGDTLHLRGDSLYYDGMTENASVDGNVEMIDKETHLYTSSVKYDVANEIARYSNGGRITNGKNTLTSLIGIYYVSDNLFNFKDSVKIVNPDYVMKADTMDYNTKTETAYFYGPSEMKGDSIYLFCERGWYDTKKDVSRIWKNAVINNRQQVITGDSLFYDNVEGHGVGYRNTVITDTTNNIIVKGNYAWYYKKPERFLVTDRAVFIQVAKEDSLFLHSDTISAITRTDSTIGEYRLMRAYHKCRIYSRKLQAKCDSLSYSFRDSVIRFYNEPVIWSEENQLVSDSIALFTKNRQAERLELYNSAFVTSQVDNFRFNQIKGRSLTGFFRDNELYRIMIEGNGETIYYLLDGEDVVGVNNAKCSRLEILVSDGKITQITEFQNPEGVIDPPSGDKSSQLRLEGFSWLDKLRPKSYGDIFKN